jgi:RHS repeat-associated protein
LDRETGLYYYGARYYDPQLAKFITPDTIVPNPSNPQDLNRYSYCNNNPINYTDPTGHSWKSVFKSIAKGFASGVVGGIVTGIITVLSGGTLTPLALAIGGMVSGAMNAALNGAGVQGILMGAAIGGILGGGLGGLALGGHQLAATLIGGALAVAGGVMSYQQGGWEAVGNYTGGVIGNIAGFVAGYGAVKGIAGAAQTNTQQTQAKAANDLNTDQKPSPKLSGPKYKVGGEGKEATFDLTYDDTPPTVGSKVYRIYDNKLYGESWTPVDPRTVPDYSTAAGLYNKGGYLAEGTLIDNSGIIVRPAKPGPDGIGGGLTEWVIPNSRSKVAVDKTSVYGLDNK